MTTTHNWMQRDLIDDHRTDRTVRAGVLIGVFLYPGSIPRVIACHQYGCYYRSASCFNEVRENIPAGELHLTRTSVFTAEPHQVEELHRTGKLIVPLVDLMTRIPDGRHIEIRLMEETLTTSSGGAANDAACDA